jgi:hypothetical protein
VPPEFASWDAKATVTVGDQTLTFEHGDCETGDDGDWLVVNIGVTGDPGVFILSVGRHSVNEQARPAKGGGEFRGQEVMVMMTWRGWTQNQSGLVPGSTRLTLAPDLKSGEFQGTRLDGVAVSGSFTCE